jgi:indole-3-glycerol phosphate synthase
LTERLRAVVPSRVALVAESGISTAADVRRMRDAGADAILVGEALMRSPDPVARLREIRAWSE